MECVVGDALISSLKVNKAESYRCHARDDAIVFCVMFLTDSSRDTYCRGGWRGDGLPGGGEGQRVSGRAEERRQSRPWRNGRWTAAPQVFSVDVSDTKQSIYLLFHWFIITAIMWIIYMHATVCTI